MTMENIICPFCGQRRGLRSDQYEGGEYRLGELTIPPSEFHLIEIREISAGPGRGHKISGFGGFPVIDTKNIIQMLDSPEYAHIAEQYLYRFKAIFRDYIETGVFDISEFT